MAVQAEPITEPITEPTAPTSEPTLVATEDSGTSWSEDGIGRAAVKGALAGFVIVFFFCGALVRLSGMNTGTAFGVAAFTAIWGGPGFGGMLGAVLHHSRGDDHR